MTLGEADSLGRRQFQERDAHVSHQKPVPPAYGKSAHQHKNEIHGDTVALTPVHSFCSLNLLVSKSVFIPFGKNSSSILVSLHL